MTVAAQSKQPSNNDLAAALATAAPKDTERKLSNGELVHQAKERPIKGAVNFTSTETAVKTEPSQIVQPTPTAEQVRISAN
jgi:hypothetical protein